MLDPSNPFPIVRLARLRAPAPWRRAPRSPSGRARADRGLALSCLWAVLSLTDLDCRCAETAAESAGGLDLALVAVILQPHRPEPFAALLRGGGHRSNVDSRDWASDVARHPDGRKSVGAGT